MAAPLPPANLSGITPTDDLIARSRGTSAILGALITSAALLAGSAAGTSTTAADLSTTGPAADLAGSISATSTITGDLDSFPAGGDLQGLIAGTSSATADLTDNPALPGADLAGSLTGSSTASGDLAVGDGLQGGINGTSTATGDLSAFPIIGIDGSTAGTSTASATLTTTASLAGLIEGRSFAWATFASNFPPRIPATVDLTPFFNNDELSHDAVLNGLTPFRAIVTDYYDPIIGGTIGLAGTDPVLICQHDDILDVQDGDTVVIESYTYVVREVKPDNTGIVRLKCELPA